MCHLKISPLSLALVTRHPQIANIIHESIRYGWHPKQKQDFTFEFFEQQLSKTKPAILVIPDFNEDVVEDYDNIIDVIQLDI